MMFNPIIFISRRIITLFVTRTKLPLVFGTLATQLFIVLRSQIRSQGLISTLSTFYSINQVIRNRGSISTIVSEGCVRNPIVATAILNTLSGNWENCLKFRNIINKWIKHSLDLNLYGIFIKIYKHTLTVIILVLLLYVIQKF